MEDRGHIHNPVQQVICSLGYIHPIPNVTDFFGVREVTAECIHLGWAP